MNEETADVIIKIWAILSFIGAAWSLLMGAAALFAGSFMTLMMGAVMGAVSMGGIPFMGSVFFIALAVFFSFVGLHLWQHKDWARIAMVVLSVLSLIAFPIGTIIGVLGIYFFGFSKELIRLFK